MKKVTLILLTILLMANKSRPQEFEQISANL